MRLVEERDVVGLDARLLQTREHVVARQGVDADDQAIALVADERVASASVPARHDLERQVKERPQLALPVRDEPRRGDDEHPPDGAARQELADEQAAHDRLARAGVVGEQEADPGQREQPLVDGDPLVRQGLDERDLPSERRVEEMSVRQTLGLGDGPDDLGVGREVEDRGGIPRAGRGGVLHDGDRVGRRTPKRVRAVLLGLDEHAPQRGWRRRVAALPSAHARRAHTDAPPELGLRQAEPPSQPLDARGAVGRRFVLEGHRRGCDATSCGGRWGGGEIGESAARLAEARG